MLQSLISCKLCNNSLAGVIVIIILFLYLHVAFSLLFFQSSCD